MCTLLYTFLWSFGTHLQVCGNVTFFMGHIISLLIPLPAAGFREPAMRGHGELFKKKFFQIMAASDDIDGNSKHQQSLSAELSCATQIITLLIRLWLSLCPADVAALEAAVTSVVNDATKQVDVVSSVLLENL